MSLVESLLTAIVRADGDALVMHIGEKPYVVATSGSVELSTRPLTLEAMSDLLSQLLPVDQQGLLEELGAVEHELAFSKEGDRFVLVAARQADDIWVEIRRYREGRPEAAAPAAPGVAQPAGEMPEVKLPWPTAAETPPRVVLPMPRGSRADVPSAAAGGPQPTRLHQLLRAAADRGATTVYLVTGLSAAMRLDGEITWLEADAPIAAAEIERLILELAPEGSRQAIQRGTSAEWSVDVAEVGHVRCISFTDHRGPGAIFRLIPDHVLSADQLGLSQELQGLFSNGDGIVLVTGRRGNGKSTVTAAFVDLVNRTRSDYVIALQTHITASHESRRAFVSQREVRGGLEDMARMARSALREDPDVLVIEDVRTPEVIGVALEAAASGRLVIATAASPSATTVIERILDAFEPERRLQVQRTLARTLRGVVTQVLLRKAGGGRLAARELLLNTPAVASLIAEGLTSQLPLALENGRQFGMVPLNDALAAFVQSGAIDPREAYRKAFDREGLLAQLKRAGIDTSFAERLA